MKKLLYGLTFLFLLTTAAQAQNCAQISVTAEAQTLSSGPGSSIFYRVAVTLDRSYDQEIVVQGFIRDETNISTQMSFSVTVAPGYTSAQTSYFFEMSPQGDLNLSTTSISPSTVTAGGVTYGTQGFSGGCGSSGSNIPAFTVMNDFATRTNNFNLDTLGKWHNEFLNLILENSTTLNYCVDEPSFNSTFNQIAHSFFYSKGIILSENVLNVSLQQYVTQNDSYDLCTSPNLSTPARDILCNLKQSIQNLADNYITISQFHSSCNTFLQSAQNLGSEHERFIVASTVKTAQYSTDYWHYKHEIYATTFIDCSGTASFNNTTIGHKFFETAENRQRRMSGPNVSLDAYIVPVHPIVGKMARADASGATSGAVAGFLFGPAMPAASFAGAIVGAGAYSAARGLFYGFTGW